jgi:C-terminal peptidase prc
VNQFYLYRDFNGLDWNAILQEYTARVQAGLTDEEFYAVLGEMIHRLGDQHSTFFSPENARKMDLEFAGAAGYAGIGVVHTPLLERGKLAVILVFPGSPAELAGIRPHDSILAVDGQPIFDEQGNRRDLLRGPEGTTIQVTVQTPGQPPRQAPITRRSISGEMPVPHRIYTTPGGKRVGYLLLRTFNESGIDERVGQALGEMLASGPLDALIVDNRHNTGGVSDVFFNTLSYFTQGEVGRFDQQGEMAPVNIPGMDMASQNLPLVVLVGRDTASFGEVFAGIIQDLGRGAIIGEQTPGNVEMMKIFDFSDGSRAWIANATFRPLNQPEVDWERTGILPDHTVSSQWDEVTEDTDPVIQAALQYFDGTLPISILNP